MAKGPTALLLPQRGLHAWDRAGQPMHDPAAHAEFMRAFAEHAPANAELHALDLHVNDDAFVDAALAIFDRWVAAGHVPRGITASASASTFTSASTPSTPHEENAA
ncbi:MAG: Tm-1-like ATP-binding domain-containing protein [Rubrivivax sp.]